MHPDRFRIVFAPSVVLPVTFTSVKAYRQDKNINVEWRVENEMNIKQYEVEKSIERYCSLLLWQLKQQLPMAGVLPSMLQQI